MISLSNIIATKNKAKTLANTAEIALGASLQEQKNKVLGSSTASTGITSVLGKTGGYKKDKDNLAGVVLG